MTNLITFDTEVDMKNIQELRVILKEKFDSKAITKISLAKTTGVDQATISRFYKHGEGLSAENFIRLTEGIGGKIVWPGENSTPSPAHDHEIEHLTRECDALRSVKTHQEQTIKAQEKTISLLEEKLESERKLEKNEAPQEAGRERRPASTANIGVDHSA